MGDFDFMSSKKDMDEFDIDAEIDIDDWLESTSKVPGDQGAQSALDDIDLQFLGSPPAISRPPSAASTPAPMSPSTDLISDAVVNL